MGYKNVANVGDRIEVTKVGSKNNMCFEPGEKGVVEESYSDGDILVNFGDGIEFFVQRESGDDYRVLSAEGSVADKTLSELYPKYYKNVEGIDEIDVYKVHELFEIDDSSGAIHHASKKLLLSGSRTGGKATYEDINEARERLSRWLGREGEE